MPIFILLSKILRTSATDVGAMADMDERFDKLLAEHHPEVKRLASYALLGPWDFMHIFEAPEAAIAAKVALLADVFGASETQTLTAIPFDEFREVARSAQEIKRARH